MIISIEVMISWRKFNLSEKEITLHSVVTLHERVHESL
jgi:hypothetical protein